MKAIFCTTRLLGDFSLMVSFPLLLSRILFTKAGCEGVAFHFIVFLARYADLFVISSQLVAIVHPSTSATLYQFLGRYFPASKVYLVAMSLCVLLAMGYRFLVDRNDATKGTKACIKFCRTFAIYVIPALCLGYRFNYCYPFVSHYMKQTGSPLLTWWNLERAQYLEVLWSFSQILSAVADIPQYKEYSSFLDGRISQDWWLMTSMTAFVFFRHFYMIHWVHRWIEQGYFDPIAVASSLVEIGIFWNFFVSCRIKLESNARLRVMVDEEAGEKKEEELISEDK